MKIYVDAMGGDHAPAEIVKGAVLAARDFDRKIHLIGNQELLEQELVKHGSVEGLIEIVHASEVVKNEDEPARVIRQKKDSSMVVGMRLLKEEPDAILVSAGSTGALLAGGTLLLGRIKGIQRPALTVALPSGKATPTLLLDVGANADCKASYLVQFAMMASVYAQNILDIPDPKVGLINIGTEANKGNELYKETYALLETSGLHFIGNVESRDLVTSEADILVCDGFTGNIILKLTEGLSGYIMGALKTAMTENLRSTMGAMLLKPALKKFKTKFDYKEYGGAPLLGIKSGIIKAHGSSDAKAFYNAIRQGIVFQEKKVLEKISNKIVEIQ
ncbi:phosphate acyltransferase PlsX [Alkalibacter rhizosphaerae]|uniref:Phosphate acyltransferase n=1 Tax=Alkalibacter rhizosphaerae TaxID=2815577 RepID=A0A974XHA8_9FIRM|nr:phosphate acyltransferase PlsX [Alkalibacter rhizosphaerae]QSX08730.1 phosphate acyltransferase PlsX [Alkalibacter rhizosphaerae]